MRLIGEGAPRDRFKGVSNQNAAFYLVLLKEAGLTQPGKTLTEKHNKTGICIRFKSNIELNKCNGAYYLKVT